MSIDRITRVNELLRREIGEMLYRVIREPDVDLSAVTVTHVVIGRDLRQARVLVSVRGDIEAGKRLLTVLRRHRHEIQQQISRDISLKYTPRLLFELDTSLERGDRVLSVLSELEEQAGADTDLPDGGPQPE